MGSHIAVKVAEVQGKLGAWEADKRNEQQKYDYISADAVLSRVGRVMADVGLAVIPAIVDEQLSETVGTNQYGKETRRFDVRISMEMVLTCDGDRDSALWFGRGTDYSSPDKALYKAITSGHKYFLMKLFNIGIGNEDGEHEAPPDAPVTRENGAKAPTPPPAPEMPVQQSTDATEGAPINIVAWRKHVIQQVPRYENTHALKGVLAKLGIDEPATRAEGVETLNVLKRYAANRDAGMETDAALAAALEAGGD